MSTKTIRLYGDMGKRFGQRFDLVVATPAEAIRALSAMVPGFAAYLRERADKPFRVLVDQTSLDEKGLQAPVAQCEVIKIVPLVRGAKDGLGSILVGAVLIAAGVLLFQPWMVNMGISVALGGVAQLLAKPPVNSTVGLDPNNDLKSWSFNSPTLTTGQGGCVPLGYGLMRIGGHVISAGVDAQTWQPGGFGGLCTTDDGTQYGDGDTTPWMWALEP